MNSASDQIVPCPHCGTKNRLPLGQDPVHAKCGKCHQPLSVDGSGTEPTGHYTLRCTSCGRKNRVPRSKAKAGVKCGNCKKPLDVDGLFLPQPVMISDANFEQYVLRSPLPVLMFAWAPWCPSCGAMAPIIDEFAADAKQKIRVTKLNVEPNPMLSNKYNILSVPMLFIFDNGKLIESFPGGMQKHDLMMKMARYL